MKQLYPPQHLSLPSQPKTSVVRYGELEQVGLEIVTPLKEEDYLMEITDHSKRGIFRQSPNHQNIEMSSNLVGLCWINYTTTGRTTIVVRRIR